MIYIQLLLTAIILSLIAKIIPNIKGIIKEDVNYTLDTKPKKKKSKAKNEKNTKHTQ